MRTPFRTLDLGRFAQKRIACVTLDLEQDYGHLGHFLDKPTYEAFSALGRLTDLLLSAKIPLTCFVQGSLFESHPYLIDQMAPLKAEFEVHTYTHPPPQTIDHAYEIEKSCEVYRDFFGKDPQGYRTPSGMVSDQLFSLLPDYPFKFDSSVVPSARPGVYNSLDKPIVPYFIGDSDVIEFPSAVYSNTLRIPISLSYLKLLGNPAMWFMEFSSLPNVVIFSFHLHDLMILDSLKKIPAACTERLIFHRIYMRNDGFEMLGNVIALLRRKGYEFFKMDNLYRLVETAT
jgi:hypothetical protein